MDNSLLAVRDINHKYIVVEEEELLFLKVKILEMKKYTETKNHMQHYG